MPQYRNLREEFSNIFLQKNTPSRSQNRARKTQRMPAESSIYWSSVDSRKSTSGSSGSDAGSRHYVDPWDLENYAYLRRHSVTDVPRRTRCPPTNERSSRETRACSEYW